MNNDDTKNQHKNRLLDEYIHTVIKGYSILSKEDDTFIIVNLQGKIVYANPCFRILIEDYSNSILKKTADQFLQQINLLEELKKETLVNLDTKLCKRADEMTDVNITFIPVFSHNELIGKYLVMKDISPIKTKRRQQDIFYDKLIEHFHDAIVIVKNSTILNVNQAGLTLIGLNEKDELIGKSITSVIVPKEMLLLKQKKEENELEKINSYKLYEYQLLRADNEVIDTEVQVFPTFYQEQQASLLVIKDISEKKRNLELSIQLEKLSATGQLAAGIAHEIRNPVTAIKGFLQLMKDENDSLNKYYQTILSETGRIETIINELLVLAKPYNKKYVKEDICTILQQVVNLMESQALLNNIQITQRLTIEKTKIFCDTNQMKQVFINFMKNAIEAMPDGGQLLIEAINTPDDSIQIRITDHGSGIPNDVLNRIGEPFFSTKENGTGLGVLVSKQIIEQHHGTLAIRSSENGTCVEVNVPCYSSIVFRQAFGEKCY